MNHEDHIPNGVQSHRLPVRSCGQFHKPVEVGPGGSVLPLHPSEESLPEKIVRHTSEVLGEFRGHGAGHLLPVRLALAAGHSADLHEWHWDNRERQPCLE